MLLERTKFIILTEEIEKTDPFIWDFYYEIDKFILLVNQMSRSGDMIENIDLLKRVEASTKSLINMIFIKVNPELNYLIDYDDKISSGNYAKLTLKVEKIIEAIEEKRGDFFKALSNKESLESNRITNKANLDFFLSFLVGIVKDLIYNSLNQAKVNFLKIEDPGMILDKIKDENTTRINPLTKDQTLFWYLVYIHFSRTAQITVSLFKLLPKEISIRPHQITDISGLLIRSSSPSLPQTPIVSGQVGQQPNPPTQNLPVNNSPQNSEEIPDDFGEEEL